MKCALCPIPIEPGTRAVSIVGGLFPQSDPDFFMVDETVMLESYAHLECLLRTVSEHKPENKTNVASLDCDADGNPGDV